MKTDNPTSPLHINFMHSCKRSVRGVRYKTITT